MLPDLFLFHLLCIAQYLDLVLLCVFIWCHSQCTTLLGSNRLSIMWNRQPQNLSVFSDPTDESTLPLHSYLCCHSISHFTIYAIFMLFCEYTKQDILCSCSQVVLSCLNFVAGSMTHCFIMMDGLCCPCCACLQLLDASYNPQQHISFLMVKMLPVKMLPVKIPELWIFSRWGCSSIYIDQLHNQDEITDFSSRCSCSKISRAIGSFVIQYTAGLLSWLNFFNHSL